MATDLSSLFSGPTTSPSAGLLGSFGDNPQMRQAQALMAAARPTQLAGTVPPPRLPMQAGGAVAPGAFRLGGIGAPSPGGNPALMAPQPGPAGLPLPPRSGAPFGQLGSTPGAQLNPLLARAIAQRLGTPQARGQSQGPGEANGSQLLDMLMGRQQYGGLFG